MQIKIGGMQEVARKYFPDGEALATLLGVYRPEQYKGKYVEVSATDHGEDFSLLNCRLYGYDLLRFTLQYYPSCCGIRMFHTFLVHKQLSQEFVDEIMNAFVAANRYDHEWGFGHLGASDRIEVIMVESRGDGHRDATEAVLPSLTPDIKYKQFWNFFQKHSRKCTTRLMRNSNTGNILHNMEVIF